MLYNSCNECPHNGKDSCPISQHDLETKHRICVFLPVRMPNQLKAIDLPKLPSDYFPHLQWTEYAYEDFFHLAFAAKTPNQQARQLQETLISTAAIADFRKEDITKCRFFIDGNGEGRAEMPPRNT